MKLDPNSEKPLQDYLIESLKKICEADPQLLATYVIALLKNENPRQELMNELQEFLKDETKPFVERLFKTLIDDSKTGKTSFRLDSASPSLLNKSSDSSIRKELSSSNIISSTLVINAPPPQSPSLSNNPNSVSRNKSTDDMARDDEERNYKHRRDSDYGANHHSSSNSSSSNNNNNNSNSSNNSSNVGEKRKEYQSSNSDDQPRSNKRARYNSRSPSPTFNKYDRVRSRRRDDNSRDNNNNNNNSGNNNNNGGNNNSNNSGNNNSGNNRRNQGPAPGSRKQQRCRDYDEKGFCVRGELCPYSHGSDRIIVSPGDLPPFASEQLPPGVVPYEPERASAGFGAWPPVGNNLIPMPGGGVLPMPSLDVIPPRGFVPPMPPNIADTILQLSGGRGPIPNLPMHLNNNLPILNNLPNPQQPFPQPPNQPFERKNRDRDSSRGGRGRGENRGNSRFDRNRDNNSNNNSNNNPNNNELNNDNSNNNDSMQTDNNQESQTSTSTNDSSGFSQPSKDSKFEPSNTVLIRNVPPEDLNIEKLNGHFKQFGSITNITIKQQQGNALVQFNDLSSAISAKNSPVAVFGNRFIQVLWSKRKGTSDSFSKNSDFSGRDLTPKSSQPNASVAPVPTPSNMVSVTKPGAKTLTLKDQPKVITEEERKKINAEKQGIVKSELEKAKELLDLLSKATNISNEEKDKIKQRVAALTSRVETTIQKDSSKTAEKLKQTTTIPPTTTTSTNPTPTTIPKRTGTHMSATFNNPKPTTTTTTSDSTTNDEIPSSENATNLEKETISTNATTTTATTNSESSNTTDSDRLEKLQNRLQSLQQIAATLGIDANSGAPKPTTTASTTATSTTPITKAPVLRGGPMMGGRGRAGSVAFQPRGGISARGRGRGMAPPNSFKLDNRTTTVKISQVPAELRDPLLIREHFQSFGPISSVNFQGDAALVQFESRRSAETAMNAKANKVSIKNLELPLTWSQAGGVAVGNTNSENQPTQQSSSNSDSTNANNNNNQESEEPVVEVFGTEQEGNEQQSDDEERSWRR